MVIRIKIAIADDHDVFKQGMQTIFKFVPDMNLMITTCSGVDLLEQMKANKPDVVLLDLRMPIMDGLSTLRELKKLYPDIKVLILSMNAGPQMLKKLSGSEQMDICLKALTLR